MTSDNNVQKKCGFCSESIPVGAVRCPYCGSILEVTFDNNYRITPPENPTIKVGTDMRSPLSNGMKVFLTVICTIIPGIGQLAGIITAIVFMNSEDDSDRKSFGVALLVASLIMFVFACIGCFILVIAFSSSNQFMY